LKRKKKAKDKMARYKLRKEMEKDKADKKRTFEFMRIKRLDKETVLYKHHILHKELEEGDFFGRRSVLQKSDLELYQGINKEQNLDPKAKLSVIVSTPKVKLYEMSAYKLLFLPDYL
jgi:hypothetical protein